MSRLIGFGLIGCGVWGEAHARTYSGLPNTKLVAVCDQDQERVKQFAQKFNNARYYRNANDLLNDDEIDAVSIVTPDFTHTELIIAALEAGKHVLVEKPLATTIDECNKIIRVRDKQGLTLMVNYSNRWKTPFIHVRKSVTSGELGELLMMNLKLNDTLYVPTKMLSWASKSNTLHFLGTHIIDLVRWISQSEIKRVYSVSRSIVLKEMGINTPDYFQSILELNSGGTVYMENCWIISENAPSVFEFKAEFVGSKATIAVNVSHHRMIEKYTMTGASMPDVNEQYDLDGNSSGQISIQHFVDCITNNTLPYVSGEDGLEATKVVVALEDSARTRQPVDL